MKTMMEAALARRAETAQRTDRPRQRRMAEPAGSLARASARLASVELRDAEIEGHLTFDGIASATERGYQMWDFWGPYTEIIAAGAFEQTLARADLDVPLVLGHDQMRRIARTTNGTLQLEEIDAGLHVLAPDLDPADADVAYIVPKLRSGLTDEMSFAFRIVSGQWSPDYEEYRITAVELHRGDVAIVGYGANPYTSASVRADQDLGRLRRLQLLARAS